VTRNPPNRTGAAPSRPRFLVTAPGGVQGVPPTSMSPCSARTERASLPSGELARPMRQHRSLSHSGRGSVPRRRRKFDELFVNELLRVVGSALVVGAVLASRGSSPSKAVNLTAALAPSTGETAVLHATTSTGAGRPLKQARPRSTPGIWRERSVADESLDPQVVAAVWAIPNSPAHHPSGAGVPGQPGGTARGEV